MTTIERVQRVGVPLVFVGWVAQVVDAWPALVAHLSPRMWLSLVGLHGVALVIAFSLYFRSEKQPALTRGDLMPVLGIWMMTWLVDFSLFTKLAN